MSDDSKLIVVAFDGMDYEKMKQFGMPNILDRTEEHGTIDVSMLKEVKTGEAFTTLITGESWQVHGCTGLQKVRMGDTAEKIESVFQRFPGVAEKTHGLRESVYQSVNSLEYWKEPYTKESYQCDTVFDTCGGRPLYVPGYNPEMEWVSGFPIKALEKGYSAETVDAKAWEHTWKRKESFDELNHKWWDFIFLHLHQPDYSHHLKGEADVQDYHILDSWAGDVLERFPDSTVVFLSDHGMPDGKEHNENAFYSANTELFGERTPALTDFREKFEELMKE